jgi:YbbR domain-containing protein
MDEVSSGDTTVQLRPSWFRVSGREVVVEDMTPGVVSISFEPIVRRQVNLSVQMTGTPPQGVSLAGPPVIDPPDVTVVGSASWFQGLDYLELVPFDLSRLIDTGPYSLGVDTTGLSGVDILPMEASVSVPVEPTATREFLDQVVVVPSLPSDPQLQVRPATVTVVLVGARSLIEAVDPADLRVTVPIGLASLAPGREERVSVVLEGIPDFTVARTNPDWVLLRRPVGQ